MKRGTIAVLGVALALRLIAVLVCDGNVADVRRYHKVATHVLDVSPNPYLTRGLYPYPPVWVWFEAAAEWGARRDLGSFPVLVKLPVVAADLLIVWLLLRGAPRPRRAAWVYALHPVAVLVTGVHGQFEALCLAPLLFALDAHDRGHLDASALALGLAIAVKSFPVLVLPLALLSPGVPARWGARLRYAALCLAPMTLLLIPYALHDLGALRRELFGYGGVADFGWIALYRGWHWLATGELWASTPRHWPLAIPFAKAVFLAAYVALLAATWRGAVRLGLRELALVTFLAFQVLYGALSVQYLLWVVALAAWRPDRWMLAHGALATLAATAFYAFLAPGVLLPGALEGMARQVAGVAWVLGVAGLLVVSAWWLTSLLRRGRPAPS